MEELWKNYHMEGVKKEDQADRGGEGGQPPLAQPMTFCEWFALFGPIWYLFSRLLL